MAIILPDRIKKYPFRTVMAYDAYEFEYDNLTGDDIQLFAPVTTAAAKVLNCKVFTDNIKYSIYFSRADTKELTFDTFLYYKDVNMTIFDSYIDAYFINDIYKHEEIVDYLPDNKKNDTRYVEQKKYEGCYIHLLSENSQPFSYLKLFICFEDLDHIRNTKLY
jgi:hypothetical protein